MQSYNRTIALIPRSQENIVIDKQGRALLTGHGLDSVYSDFNFYAIHERFRWSTPEMRYIEDRMWETKEGDVFAFWMVAVEVLTGRVPFHKLDGLTAGLRIYKGKYQRSLMMLRR